MNATNPEVKEIKSLQSSFRNKFNALKNKKDELVKLFRRKLEEKKVKEVKKDISGSNF